jgi:hypothetical protein
MKCIFAAYFFWKHLEWLHIEEHGASNSSCMVFIIENSWWVVVLVDKND